MDVPIDSFTHDGRVYNLTKVRILTRPHKAYFVKTSELLWILRFDKPNEDRVKASKLRWPLLVALDRKGRKTVVDGLHRLERCRRKGITTVPVKFVTPEMLEKAYLGEEKSFTHVYKK